MDLEKKFLSDFLSDLNANRVVLPTLPEVAMQVRKAVGDPQATTARIEKIINSDPALSTKLLKVENSPAYRGSEPITNLRMAITRLGTNQIRNLATGLVMEQLYQVTSTDNIKQHLKDLWLHSTRVATLSHVIARRFTKLKPDEAMLAGLIHDIGTLPILNRASLFPELLEDDEKLIAVMQRLHTMIGPAVLDEWGFSRDMVIVSAEHEDIYQARDGEVDYVDVIIVANLHSYLGTQNRLAKINWEEVPAFAKIGMTPEDSFAAMEEARDEMREMQGILASSG
jgi:HD-like signal output (HDOD) protein